VPLPGNCRVCWFHNSRFQQTSHNIYFRPGGNNKRITEVRFMEICMEIDQKHICEFCMEYMSEVTNIASAENFRVISDKCNIAVPWKLVLLMIFTS
jgi:hypothetical protein